MDAREMREWGRYGEYYGRTHFDPSHAADAMGIMNPMTRSSLDGERPHVCASIAYQLGSPSHRYVSSG